MLGGVNIECQKSWWRGQWVPHCCEKSTFSWNSLFDQSVPVASRFRIVPIWDLVVLRPLFQSNELTFSIITSYAEMRSLATKSSVSSSTANKSRTLPDATLGSLP